MVKPTNQHYRLQILGSAIRDSWILPLINQQLQSLLENWHTKEHAEALHSLRVQIRSAPSHLKTPLTKKINDYLTDCLIRQGSIDRPDKRLIAALILVWKTAAANKDLGFVALNVAEGNSFFNKFRCRCLTLLPTLTPSFWTSVREVLELWENDPNKACVLLTKLLGPMPPSEASGYWRHTLYGMIKKQGQRLIDYALNHMKIAEWVQFALEVQSVCSQIDVHEPYPALIAPDLQAWIARVTQYTSVITQIEKDLGGPRPITKCFWLGFQGPADSVENIGLENILAVFSTGYKGIHQPVMLTLLKLLSVDGSNSTQTWKVMSFVVRSTQSSLDACMRVLELHGGRGTTMVAEAMLASWLQPSNMGQFDQNTLEALSELLGMSNISTSQKKLPIESLEAAADYLDKQFAELFIEAQRLEGLRAAYNRVDPDGISALLKKLNIENPSPLADFIAKLPPSLVGIVEVVDDNAVEIQFPLKLTPLEQIATGAGNAQNLVVRLVLTDYPKAPPFCIHLDNEKKAAASALSGHSPWNPASKVVPDQHTCSSRPSRLTYQLSRILARHLHSGFKSIEEIHKLITTALKDLTKCCVSCGSPKNTQLRRSGPCQIGCSNVFLRSSLEVRLAEIRHDPTVMDLLLYSVHYAAASRKLELLPGCPFSDTLAVDTALRKIPPISKLTNVADLAVAVRKLGADSEKLLSWTTLNYRGFIASATGKMRIPGMPVGTHQFIVANAAPDLETAFKNQIGSVSTRVLWHGTSMDRLYAIITEGLKVCSGTALQTHGAASGAGIYTAVEPVTSWSYCALPGTAGWSGSKLSNVRVLLGLEGAGNFSGNGVYVVQNPSQLMVRYIFLVPNGASIPVAANVAPAMLSVYNSLRQGVL
jgi:hypothetical protein